MSFDDGLKQERSDPLGASAGPQDDSIDMKKVSNRKSDLAKLFQELQACVATGIDPFKHTVLGKSAILNIDASKINNVRKEVGKLLACEEASTFTAQELEQLLLETAAAHVTPGNTAQANAASAVADFVVQLNNRVKPYFVPFVTPGLRVGVMPPGMTAFRIGACEFSSDPKRLRQIFRAIEIPVRFRVRHRHAFPKDGYLVLPKGETVAVVQVETSSRYATIEAQALLEEAYGFFVLHQDAVADTGPGGSSTRMPLLSWQYSPALAPTCRIATGPATIPSQYRFGTGFDQLWHKGYEIDLLTMEPKLGAIGFFTLEQELFSSHAQTEMAGRIRTALRWLARAIQAHQAETQFLNFAIALESLFTAPSSNYKISAIIRDCVAKAASWSDSDEVRRLVSKLYGRRSGIVHQGIVTQFIQEMEELHTIVVQCLGELLQAGDHRDGYESMLNRLGLHLADYLQEDPATPVELPIVDNIDPAANSISVAGGHDPGNRC
jgi:hypothetical protein